MHKVRLDNRCRRCLLEVSIDFLASFLPDCFLSSEHVSMPKYHLCLYHHHDSFHHLSTQTSYGTTASTLPFFTAFHLHQVSRAALCNKERCGTRISNMQAVIFSKVAIHNLDGFDGKGGRATLSP